MKFIIIITLFIGFLNADLVVVKPKYALLIGNSHYRYIDNLKDPSSNLKRLKEVLGDLGFNVKIEYDLNSEELEEAINRFASRLSRDSNSIGFLYYTGHGCQVDYQGYLVPINVDTRYKLKIKYNALNINKMLETLGEAGNGLNMVFLDACRNVPTGLKGGTKGLGQLVARPKGSLIVYATEAGKVASDNSRFINSLIKNISKPNQRVRDIGDNISNDVAKRSGYSQIPEVYTKLLPNIVLAKRYISPTSTYKPTSQTHSMEGITIIDGLMYQNQPFTKQYTWEKAKKYCRDLTLGGYSDWRLPMRAELNKISNIKMYGKYDNGWSYWYDKNKHRRLKGSKGKKLFVKEEFLESMQTGSYFWTLEEKDSSSASVVSFSTGNNLWNDKLFFYNYVLCVR